MIEYDDIADLLGDTPVAMPPESNPPTASASATRNAAVNAGAPQSEAGHHYVSVSRHVLYLQAVIILMVSLGALVAGYYLGRGARPQAAGTTSAGPVTIQGQVSYLADASQPLPDGQAVVIVFPQGVAPADKIPVAGLRPDDLSPADNNGALRAVEASEGIYQRADEQGRFEFQLRPGPYAILVISKHAQRPAGSPLNPEDLQLLGGYFQSAPDLIGPYRYEYSERRLPDEAPLNYLWSK